MKRVTRATLSALTFAALSGLAAPPASADSSTVIF